MESKSKEEKLRVARMRYSLLGAAFGLSAILLLLSVATPFLGNTMGDKDWVFFGLSIIFGVVSFALHFTAKGMK